MISQRVKTTQSPPLYELGNFARQQKDCISLGQGAPFYYPPADVFSFFQKEFSQHTLHQYTPDPGILTLRQKISEKLQNDQNIHTSAEQIVITPGANQAFYNVLLTISDPGDEIILLTPYYFNHYMACTSLNLLPIIVPLQTDFGLNIDSIRKNISGITKAIVFVNPGNPTGIVHSQTEIKQLVELAKENNIMIIADETYEYFVYKGSHTPVATLSDKVISISSFSKTFGIPGWRLGYYTAPNTIIQQSLKIQDTIGICAPNISQQLGIHLLDQRHKIIPTFFQLMKNNYSVAIDLLEEISWMELNESGGAYYLFPNQSTGIQTEVLVKKLIKDYGVYIVPGSGFGQNWKDNCRISFANVTEEQLKEAFSRLRAYS